MAETGIQNTKPKKTQIKAKTNMAFFSFARRFDLPSNFWSIIARWSMGILYSKPEYPKPGFRVVAIVPLLGGNSVTYPLLRHSGHFIAPT